MANITLTDVVVNFPILGQNRTLRRELLHRHTGGLLKRRDNENIVTVTALNGINLDLKDGDRIGLIGHNGSGKTTLLRVMAGAFIPTGGTVDISGRVSALFSPSLGMDLDENGIDNIKAIGLFLGLSPNEINQKMDGIIEFSELGEFIYLPVRTYSTGMLTRLTFSVLTSLEPDILLLDESIGAGDARFEKRAKERIKNFLGQASITVLASHSEAIIRDICNKAVLLERGEIVASGDLEHVIETYHQRIQDIPS